MSDCKKTAGELKILVIDESPERASVVEQGLVEAGYTGVSVIRNSFNLVQRVQALEPDVIIIDLANPDRDTLEWMFQVSREIKRPIAMFVDQSDSASIGQAIEAGVSAYVVDGLHKDRIRPVVDMAIERFRTYDRLRQERDQAVSALADRKVVDRAKGLLMQHKGLSEEDAYNVLRRNAMKQNRKLVEIAQSVITTFQMDL